ncbi:CMP-N-acetylneuraminate-poly-alpha-2,8-sialyltransferase-like isoform X1 [Strongylocentrotus purpuratus]|uniref:Uncharacterized protein n=1 Tax=Strongylocentrotus purpuratus TaxID=7668 RepID=A0A7M7GQY2_STRPU|nr:CMP-N-acetylneuraminate-poly-alpha-2,8-sialyltransferase-like isoform X1 [Strongylocentrotus purpuratus]XP_011664410.2 CMP-N-acetylneuraminate-poly-alpha-2,8-sialyltransferase-like isoform X1 [Strongylocentrotus purpuratus]
MFGEILLDRTLASFTVCRWCLQRLSAEVFRLLTTFRRRQHSRRFVIAVLSTILLYYLLLSTISYTRRPRKRKTPPILSHFMFESMHGNVNESSNFTKQIWVFNNSDAERIYLYANLLQKLPWKANPQHLDNFRRELNAETNVSTDRDLILTQTNVQLDQEMPCYFDTKKSMLKYPHFVATKDFMSTLPKESPLKGKRYEKCAVIGNSGSLKQSTCGSQIDGMDFVFRCNGAPLEGFVTDAGKRTDFLTFNPSILYKRFGGLVNESMIESYITFMKQYDSMVWYPCFGSRQLVEPCIKAISYHDQVDSRLVIGHPSHYVSIWEFWKRRGLRKKPSTGLYLVSLAATLCNEIHLYGFWPFPIQLHEGKVQETAYHYFNNLPFTSHHSSDSEFRLLLQMHMLGSVNLHMGTCTQ